MSVKLEKPALVLSPREIETLSIAWQCFEVDPKVDYTKMAELGGWANDASARAFLNKIKFKLKGHAMATGGTLSTTSTTPNKANKGGRRKRAANAEESPTKKSKGTPNSKGKAEKKVDDEDDDEFNDVPIKSEEVEGITNEFQAFIQRDIGNGRNQATKMGNGFYDEVQDN